MADDDNDHELDDEEEFDPDFEEPEEDDEDEQVYDHQKLVLYQATNTVHGPVVLFVYGEGVEELSGDVGLDPDDLGIGDGLPDSLDGGLHLAEGQLTLTDDNGEWSGINVRRLTPEELADFAQSGTLPAE